MNTNSQHIHLGHLIDFWRKVADCLPEIFHFSSGYKDAIAAAQQSRLCYPVLLAYMEGKDLKGKCKTVYHFAVEILINSTADDFARQQDILVETDIIVNKLIYFLCQPEDKTDPNAWALSSLLPAGVSIALKEQQPVCAVSNDYLYGQLMTVEMTVQRPKCLENCIIKPPCDLAACFSYVVTAQGITLENISTDAVSAVWCIFDHCHPVKELPGNSITIPLPSDRYTKVILKLDNGQCYSWAAMTFTENATAGSKGKSYPFHPTKADGQLLDIYATSPTK